LTLSIDNNIFFGAAQYLTDYDNPPDSTAFVVGKLTGDAGAVIAGGVGFVASIIGYTASGGAILTTPVTGPVGAGAGAGGIAVSASLAAGSSYVFARGTNNFSNDVKDLRAKMKSSKSNEGIGKGEQVLDKVKTFEQARNKALDLVGDLGPNSKPYTGTLKSSAGYGKVVGRQSADGKVRWRLDYDPNKGTHINIEDFRNGKGANARKIVVPFEGNESTFKSLLKHLNR
jgi:hypothetical protein